MELIHYWRVVRRWAWLIILCPFVAALAAGLISLQLQKVYEAQVSLLVRPAQPLPTDPVTLSHQITVTPEPNTTILDVAVRDTDPVRAMNTANALVGDFIAKV